MQGFNEALVSDLLSLHTLMTNDESFVETHGGTECNSETEVHGQVGKFGCSRKEDNVVML